MAHWLNTTLAHNTLKTMAYSYEKLCHDVTEMMIVYTMGGVNKDIGVSEN